MNDWVDNLTKVAKDIAKERSKLHFFGVVHPTDAPYDRWDLLVSSDKLTPWSTDSIRYIVGRLKDHLSSEEMVKIAMVVALPKNNPIIAALLKNGGRSPGNLGPLHDFDDYEVIIPTKKAVRLA
jgi:hypothetical protein